jgi:O-antigen/teichoic acid export membrane protein
MPLLVINLVLPPVIAEMYSQDKTGRLERTLRSYSTLSGVPCLLFLTVFMLLSAAKVAAVCSGFYGLVLQMTGHHKQMLRVSLLTRPLFIGGALLVV